MNADPCGSGSAALVSGIISLEEVHYKCVMFREGVTEIPVESIPGILETGWEPPPSSAKSRYTHRETFHVAQFFTQS